jgi:hypothetical protein
VTRILDTVYGEPVGNRRARKFPVGDDPEKNRRNDPGFWCGSVRWRSRAGSSAFASRMASAGSWRTRLSAPAILKYNPEHGTTAAALTSYSLRLLCWSDRSGRGNAHDEHHEGATQRGAQTMHLMFQTDGGLIGDGVCLFNLFALVPCRSTSTTAAP